MDFPPEPSGPPLDSAKEEYTPDTKLCTDFKKTIHQHKWLVSHLTFVDKLDMLQSNFKSGESRSGSDGSYILELGLSSAAWILEPNCGTQYIQVGGIVPVKL